MYWLNLKSVALPVPEIIGGTRKNWAVPGYAHAPFSLKFLMGFCSNDPLNALANLKPVAFPVPDIIGSTQKKLGSPWIRGANPQSGEGEAVWGRGWYRSKERR